MKNIHVLSTDKPSKLHTYKGILNLAADEFVAPTIVKNDLINLNIYITSNEEIKERDWIFNEELEPSVLKCSGKGSLRGWNKIILTTDIDLIKDSVQVIDDEFLEWFVSNPSCESVDVEKFRSFKEIYSPYEYMIIIPKEEPKQENCCTPAGQIKRYVDCVGCDRKPKQMSKQTALDLYEKEINFLIERYEAKEISKREFITMKHNLFYNAKEMEEEQIIDAASDHCYPTRELARIDAEQYYNETYKKDK
jgi:hypothetical protein